MRVGTVIASRSLETTFNRRARRGRGDESTKTRRLEDAETLAEVAKDGGERRAPLLCALCVLRG